MIWQKILWNGLLRLTLTRAFLASGVVATTPPSPAARAIVALAIRLSASATVPSGPLYTCNAERLSAMHQNGRAHGNVRILDCKI